MRSIGGTLFAMQLGQVIGQLASEVRRRRRNPRRRASNRRRSGSKVACCSLSNGIPTSPPETTSLASWPMTWPSCIVNRVPPMLRIIWLAPAIMLCNSSGACSVSTRVRESEMLLATGSAICVQIGVVAVTHSLRVIRRGGVVSSATEITSSSQSAAMLNAASSCVRCSVVASS